MKDGKRKHPVGSRSLSPASTIELLAHTLKSQHHARAVGIVAVTSAGAFWTRVGMHKSGHALRLPFLTPVQGVPKSPRIAAIPSARSPISRRLYLFQRCPRFLCLGRKTSAFPPLFFQRPFSALICSQHAGSLRRLPLPFAHVLRHVEAAVRVRCVVQDSCTTGIKKRTPDRHHPLLQNRGLSGVQILKARSCR